MRVGAHSLFFCTFVLDMEQFDYRNAQRYAMQLGLAVSGFWSCSFLLCMYTFPSILTDLGTLLGLASLVYVGLKMRRLYRAEESVTVMRCVWISWYTFMCTVLLTTAVQYVYFAFLDNGRMYARFEAFFNSKEVVQMYEQMQMQDLLAQMQEVVTQFGQISTKELMMSFMSMNMMIGLLFTVLTVFFLLGARKDKNGNQPA